MVGTRRERRNRASHGGLLGPLPLGQEICTFAPATPHIQPFLNYNYFEEEFDLESCAKVWRIADRFGEHEGWANLVTERAEPTDSDMESDDTLDAWIKETAVTSHHVSGTCKMGPDSDPMAVVGPVRQCSRPRELEGSRCVNHARLHLRANTNVTSMVIGERVAAFIGEGL